MYLDGYERLERRLQIQAKIEEAKSLLDEALVHLAKGDIKAADDCHTRVKHIHEQARSGIEELRADIGE